MRRAAHTVAEPTGAKAAGAAAVETVTRSILCMDIWFDILKQMQ